MAMTVSERRLGPADAPAGPSLRSRILQAAGWSMTAYACGYVLRFASSLIMTRLLVPEMFGVMAVATIVQVVASMLCDVGLRQAVIQNKRGDDPLFLDTAWTLQIIRGGVIWVACLVCAGAIFWGAATGWFAPGSVYADGELPAIIAVMALSAVILGFQSTKSMSSDRHLNQKGLAVVELGGNASGLAVAVIVGILTHSIWSFVVSNLFAAFVTVALTHWYLPGAANRLRMDRGLAWELIRFGRWILVSSLFTVLAANGDRIMLAGWTDPATLGLYVLAFNLVLMIEGGGGRLFWSVATSAFSRIAHERPEAIRTAYYRCRLPFDCVFVGGAGFLFSGGEAIVTILYDDRYVHAGAMLQILSFSLLLSRFGLASALFLALGEPQNLGLIAGIKTAALFLSATIANTLFGFEAALWAIALHGGHPEAFGAHLVDDGGHVGLRRNDHVVER
ncbi:MAG: teichoic acid transporter, partial [Mesorhizobium amorphae]